MASAVSAEKQREIRKPRGKPFEKGNKTAFKKGESGNPGGQKKGVVYISEAYKRLMALTPAELLKYKPRNVTEELALKQINRALTSEDQHAISATEKIADRTEGKAVERKEISGAGGKDLNIVKIYLPNNNRDGNPAKDTRDKTE